MRSIEFGRSATIEIGLAFALILGLVHPAFAQSPELADVKTWAFQLDGANPAEIAQSNYDLVVIDYSLGGKGNDDPASPGILEKLRRTPSGSRRIVLAYFNIGEAENYRYYWQDGWLTNRPEWLGAENPNWPGNYAVRFWRPEWQSMLFGNPNAYLDRILTAGFDGVYLDGVDKYDVWQRQFPSAKADMIDLVARVAAYGRERRMGFLIVPQNAEELLENPRYVQLIDGIGREELLYGEKEPESRNGKDSIDDSLEYLRRLRRAGKPVFVVEYIKRRELASSALRELKELGFVGYIANRELNTLTSPATDCAPQDCSR